MDKLQHRKASRRIVLVDGSGTPVAGQSVHAELARHKFLFAAGAHTLPAMLDPEVPAEVREMLQGFWESWKQLFNMGVVTFYLGRYEPEPGKTMQDANMRAAEFLKANGCRVKGHPLCWHTVDARWLMPMSNEEVLQNQLGRIHREVSAFKDTITIWDVINEAVIMPEFEKSVNAITRLCQSMGRVPLIKALFEEARRTNPDATFLINDFNTSERYRDLIAECIAAGVTPDVIGIQSHQHQGPWGLEKLQTVVDRFKGFGIPLHFTETSFVSGHLMPPEPEIIDLNDYQVDEWPTTPKGEENQARWLLEMLDFLFEQPEVHAFTIWGFEDFGQWLNAPAGLIRKDGSRKPAYDAMWQRVNRDWHTDVTLTTDENGAIDLEGFKGLYDIECLGKKASAELDEGSGDIVVTL